MCIILMAVLFPVFADCSCRWPRWWGPWSLSAWLSGQKLPAGAQWTFPERSSTFARSVKLHRTSSISSAPLISNTSFLQIGTPSVYLWGPWWILSNILKGQGWIRVEMCLCADWLVCVFLHSTEFMYLIEKKCVRCHNNKNHVWQKIIFLHWISISANIFPLFVHPINKNNNKNKIKFKKNQLKTVIMQGLSRGELWPRKPQSGLCVHTCLQIHI